MKNYFISLVFLSFLSFSDVSSNAMQAGFLGDEEESSHTVPRYKTMQARPVPLEENNAPVQPQKLGKKALKRAIVELIQGNFGPIQRYFQTAGRRLIVFLSIK